MDPKKPQEKKNDFMGTAIPRKRLPPPTSLDAPIPRRPSAVSGASRNNALLPPPHATAASSSRSMHSSSDRHHHQQQLPPPKHKLKKHKILHRALSSTTFHHSQQHPTAQARMIRVQSEDPLILRIRTKGMSRAHGIRRKSTAPTSKSSSNNALQVPRKIAGTKLPLRRKSSSSLKSTSSQAPLRGGPVRAAASKRPRSAYLEDTDSEDEALFLMPPTKKPALGASPAGTTAATGTATIQQPPGILVGVDSPPPGTLSSLWYSNESFLHMFVVDKICGWKTRPKLNSTLQPITKEVAVQLETRALQTEPIWTDAAKRMEISRIHPTHCPVVQTLAGQTSASNTTAATTTTTSDAPPPPPTDSDAPPPPPTDSDAPPPPPTDTTTEEGEAGKKDDDDDREEVLLVKWRGRSYWHCSWERAADLVRLDTSNNSQARAKIRRFYQQQEISFGPAWKQFLTEERATAAKIPSHGRPSSDTNYHRDYEPDEFFSPECLEVERIMACDESEMNMQLLEKQRQKNRQDDEEREPAVVVAARPATEGSYYAQIVAGVDTQALVAPGWPWDPEDNVRYVVKWKGLPYSEMTWEYWRDIKRDAVEETLDFWHRQQVPKLPEVQPEPNLANFRKLQESPTYGISSRSSSSNSSSNNDDEEQGFRLRGYQLEGVNWLLFNWYNRRSCILADEMGLGKTIQSAAFLRELQVQQATQVRGPFLVVAPLSLVGQWRSELLSWAPDMNVVLYHGSADAREFLVEHEFYYSDQFVPKLTAVKLKKQHVTKFHVLITTYEVLLKDSAVISKIRWKTLILDEAHRIKNPKSRLFEQLANVPRDYCVLLTGTPIANATEELWALLHFANPKVFRDKEGFLEKFGEMTDAKQVNELHSLLKPYLLRRVKEDVEKSLPPKEETILEVSLTPIQKTFYKAIYERNTSFLFKGAKPSNAPSLMNVMMELRKCCNHAFLVKGAEERILNDAASKLKLEGGAALDYYKLFGEQLVKSSGKMVLMEKLLQKLFTSGHKVLIFSQMVRVLDLLEEMLKLKKYRYERLDGSTSSSSRAHSVERFNRKSCQRFVMLLSTRAGGLGLNLTAADTVIIFDSDWNPQNDLQAMARAHRIGQTRAVRVYRLLTAKTYEMHMFHSASLKLGLERAVLSQNREQGDESDESGKPKKKNDKEAQAKKIDELLKKGAYDVFRDDDDGEAEKFMETDIEQLLEHKSKKVTYGNSATSSLSSGLGSFNKASFVANTEDGAKDVDLDDPDFWSKAVGLDAPDETSEEVAQMIDDGVKRSRKQVQVYDPHAETAEAEQRKKERIALEKMLEKEEKERLKEEKKKKQKEAKEKKKREREEQKSQLLALKQKAAAVRAAEGMAKKVAQEKNEVKEPKPPKKSKKSERLRALRRAENADPMLERLKQAWEVSQRHRATAAAIRFGFARFCKIRNESNLTGVPLQDLEVFMRAYTYQLGLQVAVTLLARLKQGDPVDMRPLFREWLGSNSQRELDWICDAVQSAMRLQLDVESYKRVLRMPVILAEPSFVTELRHGAALRALRRLGILARLNRFIDDCLNSILGVLGHEALGKRGCASGDLSSLDPDLKARYVTTEELALVIGSSFRTLRLKAPASWWDRGCDVGLVIGSFVHGLGNYEAMRNDFDLPFADKILKASHLDKACTAATHTFRIAAQAARQVFDDALESARVKAELEVQAAVAAAAKAASKREEDAAVLRKGGAEAEAVISEMPDTQVEDAFAFDGTDSHFVTLPRLQKCVQSAVRKEPLASTPRADVAESLPTVRKTDKAVHDEEGGTRVREHELLPMPDARVLDHRLLSILNEIDSVAYAGEGSADEDGKVDTDLWHKSDDVKTNISVRKHMFSYFTNDFPDIGSEYSGIGLGSNQCGTSHRSLNDGSDFAFGSGSSSLAHVAYGTDAPRYLRALGVPMNVTRFAVSGLVHADASCVKELLVLDSLRFYGKEDATSHAPASEENKKTVDSSAGAAWKSQNLGGLSADVEKKTNISIGINPTQRMPELFRKNAKLRANVCLAVLFYGFPSKSNNSRTLDHTLWTTLHEEAGVQAASVPENLFSVEQFRQLVVEALPECDIPDVDAFSTYIERFFLPHCLRLCINGNGATTRNARGSHGEYATAFGVSVHAEPSQNHPSPIPDPCLDLEEHSLEALGHALAILRRVRLLRACIHICSQNGVSVRTIKEVAQSAFMGNLDDLPVWWCPWIHDVALLVQAATGGLFSVTRKRAGHAIFSPRVLQDYLYSSFIAAKPPTRRDSPETVAAWTEGQSKAFPSLNQLERRLAFLCAKLTVGVEQECCFDCIPMFDHGGWPRN